MTCPEFWISVSPPTANGPMEPDGEERAHLRQCPACAAEFARHSRLAEGLGMVAAEFRYIQAPRRVEDRLVAAFRWQSTMPPARSRRGWLAPAIWWAAAAVLMVSAGLFLWGGRQPLPQHHARPAAVEWAESTYPASLEAGENFSADSGEFIPVPNADRFASADEQMDLVRVEVPRAAMIAFGIPISAENANEPIEADVLLGPDGLARAVRLVN